MEKYERNIKVKRILTTIDTDNDGIEDTIAYINQEDLFLPILIKQSIKDLGVYTDVKPPREVVDLGSFWNTDNDGYGDFGTNPISSGETSNYDENNTNVTTPGDFIITGCMDMNAINYSDSATVQCVSCCDYGFTGGTTSGGVSVDTPAGSIGGGCYLLGTSCKATVAELPSITTLENKADEWCKAIHPSCGTSYAIIDGCKSNGCGKAQTTGCIATASAPTVIPNPCHCCPGPANTHHLLTQAECTSEGFGCDGTFDNGCNCSSTDDGNIFGGVKWEDNSIGCGSEYRRQYKFYCVPD